MAKDEDVRTQLLQASTTEELIAILRGPA
jgi:mannitol/fructose-specific phosphotransferase system IIA component (Ntr-type)